MRYLIEIRYQSDILYEISYRNKISYIAYKISYISYIISYLICYIGIPKIISINIIKMEQYSLQCSKP